MDSILAVFRSRTQALDCVSRLKYYGVGAAAVSTPREANVGCGISVRLAEGDLHRAKRILSASGYSAFAGFLRVQVRGGRTFVRPV